MSTARIDPLLPLIIPHSMQISFIIHALTARYTMNFIRCDDTCWIMFPHSIHSAYWHASLACEQELWIHDSVMHILLQSGARSSCYVNWLLVLMHTQIPTDLQFLVLSVSVTYKGWSLSVSEWLKLFLQSAYVSCIVSVSHKLNLCFTTFSQALLHLSLWYLWLCVFTKELLNALPHR